MKHVGNPTGSGDHGGEASDVTLEPGPGQLMQVVAVEQHTAAVGAVEAGETADVVDVPEPALGP